MQKVIESTKVTCVHKTVFSLRNLEVTYQEYYKIDWRDCMGKIFEEFHGASVR